MYKCVQLDQLTADSKQSHFIKLCMQKKSEYFFFIIGKSISMYYCYFVGFVATVIVRVIFCKISLNLDRAKT